MTKTTKDKYIVPQEDNRCPECGSNKIYLVISTEKKEVRTKCYDCGWEVILSESFRNYLEEQEL